MTETWPERWSDRLFAFVAYPLSLAMRTSSKQLRALAFVCYWPWLACTVWCLLLIGPLLACQMFLEVVDGDD